jgi:hypothetical protein
MEGTIERPDEDRPIPLTRSFALFTNGKHPEFDLLGVVIECFEEMDDGQKAAAMGYLNARFVES